MYDLIIRHGQLIDGLDTPRRQADVGIIADRIATIGDLGDAEAEQVVDATDRIVAPGFVDIHSHSDLTLLSDGRARSKIAQGVTTEVNGNCGISYAPAAGPHRALVRTEGPTCDLDPDVVIDWTSFGGYLEALERARPAINAVGLVGHGPLRIGTLGVEARPATSADRRSIVQTTLAALDEGAFGVSTGLTQVPLIWADEEELVTIASAAAARDALFAIHMRNYAGGFTSALDEAIRVARRAGVRIQISHMSTSGRANWPQAHDGRATLEAAHADGLDIGFDIYPFLAGSANLSQLLPEWVQAGGSADLVARLTDSALRRRAADEWTEQRFLDWDEVEICLVDPGLEAYLGLTLAAAGEEMGVSPAEAGVELIRLTENRVCMIAYGRSDQNVMEALQHPRAVIGSDGLAMDPDGPTGVGLPHPRSFGCYPRLLGDYVRDRGVISLERAIAISTSAAAARVGLRDRGRLTEGAFADIVVFDPATVADLATYRVPKVFPRGIEHVIVNGQRAVADGRQVESVRAGRVLRRSAA